MRNDGIKECLLEYPNASQVLQVRAIEAQLVLSDLLDHTVEGCNDLRTLLR